MKKCFAYLFFVPLLFLACKPAVEDFAFEQREGYRVAHVRIPLSASDSVWAYWLLPDSVPASGCPAVLLFHDHGAWFTIGGEKLVRPLLADSALLPQADYWTKKFYAGAYVGDSLAARGYAVLVTDALYWGTGMSDALAGGADSLGSLPFDSLKAINKRLKNAQPDFYADHLALTGEHWFETILRDDRASLDWLLARPEVDPARVGLAGFSLGAYRAWMLASEDERAAWCFAANWMTTLRAHGGTLPDVSAYSMYRPMLDSVDYPDIAARAAVRPMMILYASDDPVAPPAAVEDAVARIRTFVPDAPLQVVEQEGLHRFTPLSLQLLLQFASANSRP